MYAANLNLFFLFLHRSILIICDDSVLNLTFIIYKNN